MKAFLLILTLAVTLVRCEGESAAPEPPKPAIVDKAPKRPIRSTLQACRQDFRRLCARKVPAEGTVAPKSRVQPIDCLNEKASQVENEVCKVWLNAEQTCKKSAESLNVCSPKMEIRRCFAQIKTEDLSTECTDTDFYKSLTLYRRLRRDKNVTKTL